MKRCFRLYSVLCFGAFFFPASFAAAQAPSPVFHPGDVVVFQGDSITDGGRQRTGMDFNHIMGQDYAYIIAGQVGAAYPERNINFLNRGIGGDQVRDLAARWQVDTLDLKPNLLSILVGVNDTILAGPKAETAEAFEKAYDMLLAKTISALPGIKIVLGQPFILPVRDYRATYPAQLAEVKKRQDAVARLAAKYHLPLVLYQKMFDDACQRASADHWSWDGIHPTYAGHALMAQEWLKTVNAFWPNG